MPTPTKPCQIPGCERPRPGELRTNYRKTAESPKRKLPVCPWCLLVGTSESRRFPGFNSYASVGRGPQTASTWRRIKGWLKERGYTLEQPPKPGTGRLPPKPPVDEVQLQAWLRDQGLVLRPAGPGQVPGKPSPSSTWKNATVDVDLGVERTPEEAHRDGLVEPRRRGRGYSPTEKGRAAIAQLRARRLGPELIRRRVGLGKGTVTSILQQMAVSDHE